MDHDKSVFIMGLVAGSIWMMGVVTAIWYVFR